MTTPSGWKTPKTNWAAQDSLDADDMNRIEGNLEAIENGTRSIEGKSYSLRGFFTKVAQLLADITGKTSWDDAPDMSLQDIKDQHIDRSQNVHGVGISYRVAKTSDSQGRVKWDEIVGIPDWVNRQIASRISNTTRSEYHSDGTWNNLTTTRLNTQIIDTHSSGFVAQKTATYFLYATVGVEVTDGSAEYQVRIRNNNTGAVYDSIARFLLSANGTSLGVQATVSLSQGHEIRFEFSRVGTSGGADLLKGTTAGIVEVI